MTGDPVAWRAIERGWSVLDADGNEIGRIDQVTGDLNADIFDGLTIGDGGTVLSRTRYVPAENVAAIYEGEVVLDLHADDAARLEPYEQPVSEPLASLAPQKEEPGEGKTSAGVPGRPGSNRPFGGMLGRLLSGGLFRRGL